MKEKIKNAFIFNEMTVDIEDFHEKMTEVVTKYMREWAEDDINFDIQLAMTALLSRFEVDLMDKIFVIKSGRTKNEH